MPIDIENKIAFIHIPKTGGTSIETMLMINKERHFFSPFPLPNLIPSNKTPQHFTYLELKQNLPILFLNNAHKFAFVRNPWDRFVSEYSWRKQRYQNLSHRRKKNLFYSQNDLETLEAFVRVLELPKENRECGKLGFNGHLETQLSFIVDETGTQVMDFIGRFETFEQDIQYIISHCKLNFTNVPHLQRSHRRKDYRFYYSNYTRSAVESFYNEDIDAFGYKF